MAAVADITAGILSQVGTLLGSSYSPLQFVLDIKANKLSQSSKRYGVIPGSAYEVQGVIGNVTLDHQFTIILTDTFKAGPASQINDELKAQRIIELQDKSIEIYKRLAKYAHTLSPTVALISQLTIETTEFLDDDDVAVQRFTLNIKYRQSI